MAAVQENPTTTETLSEYFRKDGRHEASQRQTDVNDINTTSRPNSPKHGTQPSLYDHLGILTDQPKYRQYGTIDSRNASFKNWPKGKTQDTKLLALAGFVYTGANDSVRCYHCNIGLSDWSEGACPWEQHVLAKPSCRHVLQCKGNWFVRHVLGENDNESDVDDSDDILDTLQLSTERNKTAVSVARYYCSNEEVLKRAMQSVIKYDVTKMYNAVELVKAIDEIEESIETKQACVTTKTATDNDASTDVETDGGVSYSEEYIPPSTAIECDGATGVETDGDISDSEEDIEEINKQLKDQVACKICFDAIASIITLPCGHMISCSQCISALSNCAMCRTEIKGTVRALMAV